MIYVTWSGWARQISWWRRTIQLFTVDRSFIDSSILQLHRCHIHNCRSYNQLFHGISLVQVLVIRMTNRRWWLFCCRSIEYDNHTSEEIQLQVCCKAFWCQHEAVMLNVWSKFQETFCTAENSLMMWFMGHIFQTEKGQCLRLEEVCYWQPWIKCSFVCNFLHIKCLLFQFLPTCSGWVAWISLPCRLGLFLYIAYERSKLTSCEISNENEPK